MEKVMRRRRARGPLSRVKLTVYIRHLARDRALFDRQRMQGDQALASADTGKLRETIFAVWDNRYGGGTQTNVSERAGLMRR